MNKQQLAAKIWASANKMRSKIEANEYKDYILGFIFYKFLSDKEVAFLVQQGMTDEEMKELTEEDDSTVTFIQQGVGYFIAYDNLFSTWLKMEGSFTVANVRDALSAFNRNIHPGHKKLFDKIFDTLQNGLSKLGTTTAEQNTAVRDLIALIRDIPTDGRQDYDVLGFVYEYLISNFAANAGKKAGEFYTPHEVSVMMSEIIAHHLRNNEEIHIYDPTSGSGSLLINIGKAVARYIENKDNIKYYAQELKQNTFNLTRMNLVMRGISPYNIECRNGDTLADDWPMFDESDPQGTYDPLHVEAVVSNPPYSQEWDPSDQDSDPRYSDFGLAPRGCADYAFLLHDLYHVKPKGIMTIVLPHGVLYRGGSEYQIRKNLVEHNHIDAIIGLPEKVFFGTGISTIVMVLKRKTEEDDDNTLFVDASTGYQKEGKNNRLRACDIKKIVDAVTTRTETPDFARLVSRDLIRQNDYNLNITRYVDSSPKAEQFDIYATMFGGIPESDLTNLQRYWDAFVNLMEQLFETNADGYSHVRTQDVQQTIGQNADVKLFVNQYRADIAMLSLTLEERLIKPMLTLSIPQTQDSISNDIFEITKSYPLVDKYQAYQFFSNDWEQIATDLEVIHTEGFDAVKQVDPRMVMKNNEEVQDGWQGHVLPFELVQEQLLADDVEQIRQLEQKLEDTVSSYQVYIDSLTPEQKEKPILSEDQTYFVAAEVKKEMKRITANVVTPETELLQNYPQRKADKLTFVEEHPEINWDLAVKDKSGTYSKSQINSLIRYYQESYSFEMDSYEDIVKRVYQTQEDEKRLKEELKQRQETLIRTTIQTILNLDDETAIELLRRKWFDPLMESLLRIPKEVIASLADRVHQLANKYAVTYQDITQRIADSESQLHDMIGELVGCDADNQGLAEFQKTLNAKQNEREQTEDKI